MAQGSFVSFLRRKDYTYATEIMGDVINTQSYCVKLLESIVSFRQGCVTG